MWCYWSFLNWKSDICPCIDQKPPNMRNEVRREPGITTLQHRNMELSRDNHTTGDNLGTIFCSLCSVSCLHRTGESGGGNLECGIRKDSGARKQSLVRAHYLLIQQPRARWRVDNGSICKQSCAGTRIMLSFPSNQGTGENMGSSVNIVLTPSQPVTHSPLLCAVSVHTWLHNQIMMTLMLNIIVTPITLLLVNYRRHAAFLSVLDQALALM